VSVLGLQLAVSFGRNLESAPLGSVGCALPVRKTVPGGPWISPGAESFDLGAQVGLVVEPGAGDAGCAGDGFEGDRGSGPVDFAQGADGLGAG
jgi:hypothetical protein